MTNQNPITPTPELVRDWARFQSLNDPDALCRRVATLAAQWGADQELEACCRWLPKLPPWSANDLRKHRRPKPPTLKEQALAALHAVATGANDTREQHQDLDTIRRALEALPND